MKEEKKTVKNKKVLIIASISLVIIICSLSCFIFFNRTDADKTTESEDNSNVNESSQTEWEKHCLSKMDDIMANNEFIRPGLELIETSREEATEICDAENVINNKNVDGLIYRNTLLCRLGDEVLFIAEVYNYTYEDVEAKVNEIVLLDKDKNELTSIEVHMNPIKSAESGIALKFTKDVDFSLDIVQDYEVREK